MTNCVIVKGYYPFCSEEEADQGKENCDYFEQDWRRGFRDSPLPRPEITSSCKHFILDKRVCTCRAAINEAELMKKLEDL